MVALDKGLAFWDIWKLRPQLWQLNGVVVGIVKAKGNSAKSGQRQSPRITKITTSITLPEEPFPLTFTYGDAHRGQVGPGRLVGCATCTVATGAVGGTAAGLMGAWKTYPHVHLAAKGGQVFPQRGQSLPPLIPRCTCTNRILFLLSRNRKLLSPILDPMKTMRMD
jgi:hypothetical protein